MVHWFARVQARLSLPEFVTMRLVIGLLLSLGFLLAFAALAEDVTEQETVVRFDRALDDALHATMTVQTAKIYEFISLFGSQAVLIITLIIAIYYVYKRRWVHLSVWSVAIAGGEILNLVLKGLINRPRPVYADPFVVEIYTSFPSGHAMLSVILYGMLSYFLILTVKNLRLRIFIFFDAVLIVELIGISRLYLGVHYLSDVIAGYLAGGIWLITCISAMDFIRARRSKAELHENA